MKRSNAIYKVAEDLFYRDLAREHQFWYREEDKPLFEDCKEKEWYLSDARNILQSIENLGMLPPEHFATLKNGSEVRILDWEPEEEV